MDRKILLPNELKEELFGLTRRNNEVRGFLLYRPTICDGSLICPLEEHITLAEGTESSVLMDQLNSRLMQEFLSQTNYVFLDSHTHSEGSVARYGEYVASNFSYGDLYEFAKTRRTNPQYLHLLITPKRLLLNGENAEIIEVSDDEMRSIVPDYDNGKRFIQNTLTRLVRGGY